MKRVAMMLVCLIAALPLKGRAVELAREQSFEIPSQPLSSALILFSQQAHLQVVTAGRRIANASSKPIKGRYTVARALDLMLEGTGFTYRPVGDETISIIATTLSVQPRRITLTDPETGESGALANAGSREPDALPAQEVVVTGTRVWDRTVAESLSPIDVIAQDAMSSGGSTALNDQLGRLLPSFNFPRPAITDGTDHVRPAQLRGLSPDQTLVMINGKRRHTTAIVNMNGSIGRGSSPVDLNAIPTSAVQHIEVLRDGASALYGSDAIAGVINMILRQERSGGSGDVRYGEYKAGDGAMRQVSGWVGMPILADGFLTLSAEFRDRQPTDRSGPDPRLQYPLLPGGVPDPREATFDRNVFRYGEPSTEDRIVFLNGGVPLANGSTAYFIANYSDRNGQSAGFFRRPGEADRNIPEIYPNGFLPFITSNVADKGLIAGVRGETGGWRWDTSANYGGNRFQFGVENSLNWSLGAASPTRFDDGTLNNEQVLANVDAVRSLEVEGLSAPLNLAAGLEYRHEHYQIIAGEPASYFGGGSQVFPGFRPADVVDTTRHSSAAYVDVETSFTNRLTASGAARFERYSDFGGAASGKLSARYALNDRLALRATGSTGFRAPSLAQQNYSTTASLFAANGAPPYEVHTFRVSDPIAVALGAEPLEPEKSRNLSVGVVSRLTPAFFVTLDIYRIEVNDRIILSENLTGANVRSFLTSRGFLNSDGGRYFTNAVDTRTEGADLVGRYIAAYDHGGKLSVTLGYNWNTTSLERVAPDPPILQLNGFDFERIGRQERGRITQGTPRDKLIFNAEYSHGPLQLQLGGARYGEWSDVNVEPARAQTFGAETVFDVSATLQLQQGLSVTLGADNVTDAYPDQMIPANNFQGILPYSPMSPFGFNGAFYYLRVRYDVPR